VPITVIPTGKNSVLYLWTKTDGNISITDNRGNPLPSNIVTVPDGGSVTFTAGESGLTEYLWTLNGGTVGTDATYTFSAKDMQNTKNYIIGLMMKKDDKPHYTQITVLIEE